MPAEDGGCQGTGQNLNTKDKEVLEAQLQQRCIEVVRRIPEPHLHQWLLLLLRPDCGLSFIPWGLPPLPGPLTLTQKGPEQEQWATYCKEEMGGKGVGSHQQSRQPGKARTL